MFSVLLLKIGPRVLLCQSFDIRCSILESKFLSESYLLVRNEVQIALTRASE